LWHAARGRSERNNDDEQGRLAHEPSLSPEAVRLYHREGCSTSRRANTRPGAALRPSNSSCMPREEPGSRRPIRRGTSHGIAVADDIRNDLTGGASALTGARSDESTESLSSFSVTAGGDYHIQITAPSR
jgi:hypothetical protein